MGEMLSPGEFVVLDWPLTDGTASKKRPALVLSEPDGHEDVQLLKVSLDALFDLVVIT